VFKTYKLLVPLTVRVLEVKPAVVVVYKLEVPVTVKEAKLEDPEIVKDVAVVVCRVEVPVTVRPLYKKPVPSTNKFPSIPIAPPTFINPPTFKSSTIPTPPETTSAPFELVVDYTVDPITTLAVVDVPNCIILEVPSASESK
jgi:hypothetical protein